MKLAKVEPAQQLVCVEKAKQMLAEAKSVGEVKAIRDQAQAVAHYLKQQAASFQAQQDAAEIKLRAERRLGEMLRETVNHKGSRGQLKGSTVKPQESTLPIGVSKTQSHRWQAVATVPEQRFEQYIAQCLETWEELTTKGALRLAKEQRREATRESNRRLVEASTEEAGTPELEDRRFPCIVLDPPWDWGDEGDQDQLGRARPQYATLSFEGVRDFEPLNDGRSIADFADVNAHIYLWITNRSLPKGFALLEHWGFRYVTCLTWCKPHFGMGNYFRGQTEHILFGVKGSLSLLRGDVGTWFMADRPGRHSEKPEEFYQLVETCSPGQWLELFSRKRRNGWVNLGAEV